MACQKGLMLWHAKRCQGYGMPKGTSGVACQKVPGVWHAKRDQWCSMPKVTITAYIVPFCLHTYTHTYPTIHNIKLLCFYHNCYTSPHHTQYQMVMFLSVFSHPTTIHNIKWLCLCQYGQTTPPVHTISSGYIFIGMVTPPTIHNIKWLCLYQYGHTPPPAIHNMKWLYFYQYGHTPPPYTISTGYVCVSIITFSFTTFNCHDSSLLTSAKCLLQVNTSIPLNTLAT